MYSSEIQRELKCPRCDSPNTKFCYYNNYNMSQPRHFCKSCKRYWTKGGTLRNIPVGGASRKTAKHKKASQNINIIPPNFGFSSLCDHYVGLPPNLQINGSDLVAHARNDNDDDIYTPPSHFQ